MSLSCSALKYSSFQEGMVSFEGCYIAVLYTPRFIAQSRVADFLEVNSIVLEYLKVAVNLIILSIGDIDEARQS